MGSLGWTAAKLPDSPAPVAFMIGEHQQLEHSPKSKRRREYHANGNLAWECLYKNEKEVGTCRWYYENGQMEEEHAYEMGVLDGLSRQWYENGQLEREGWMKEDERDGVWTFYDKKGGVIAKGTYDKGYPFDGIFVRHLKGNNDQLHRYEEGALIEEITLDWEKAVKGESKNEEQKQEEAWDEK
jgi:hypothetical protein